MTMFNIGCEDIDIDLNAVTWHTLAIDEETLLPTNETPEDVAYILVKDKHGKITTVEMASMYESEGYFSKLVVPAHGYWNDFAECEWAYIPGQEPDPNAQPTLYDLNMGAWVRATLEG